MDGPEAVKEIAKQVGGTITEMGRLPDNSGFAVMSMPLPKTHWIYGDKSTEGEHGFEAPPMILRIGREEQFTASSLFQLNGFPEVLTRESLAEKIREAGRYAVRAATMKGTEMDFDPDALVQNLVTGILGYWTPDGLSNDQWANPKRKTEK